MSRKKVGLFVTCAAKKDVDGAVIIGPRNFTTRPLRGGKDEKVYFQPASSYNCRGDVYQPPIRQVTRLEIKDGYKLIGKQDVNFKPCKTVRDLYHRAPFEHESDRVDIKKNYRDEDGAVITAPRNITTNPPKKGLVGRQTSFGGIPAHLPDDYENAKAIATKEFKHAKAKEQEKPWSSKVKLRGDFNGPKAVYGEDVFIP